MILVLQLVLPVFQCMQKIIRVKLGHPASTFNIAKFSSFTGDDGDDGEWRHLLRFVAHYLLWILILSHGLTA